MWRPPDVFVRVLPEDGLTHYISDLATFPVQRRVSDARYMRRCDARYFHHVGLPQYPGVVTCLECLTKGPE